MADALFKKFKEITGILPYDRPYFEGEGLLKLYNGGILTPIGDVLPILFSHRSNLEDQFIDVGLIIKLADILNKNHSIVRLSHIGFCYKVDSQEKEKERITELVKKSNFNLYQEPSSDEGLWLFVGDINNLENPVIELLLIEKTKDQQVDYWLPHIQIDLDTALSEQEIDNLVGSVFGDLITPFHITIDGVVYIVRNRLGVIDGVNLMLDLATDSRNVKVSRQEIWHKIV